MYIVPFNLLVKYNKLCIMTRSIIIRFGGIQESQSFKIIGLLKKKYLKRGFDVEKSTPRPGLEPGSKDPQSSRMSTTPPGP